MYIVPVPIDPASWSLGASVGYWPEGDLDLSKNEPLGEGLVYEAYPSVAGTSTQMARVLCLLRLRWEHRFQRCWTCAAQTVDRLESMFRRIPTTVHRPYEIWKTA